MSRLSHGLSKTHEYYTFNRILNSIKNPNNKSYYRYGGRGIDFDPRYDPEYEKQGKVKAFNNFISDLKELGLYSIPKGYHLDRINNDKGYWKDNVRSVTARENLQNRQCNTVTVEIVKKIRSDYKTGKYSQSELAKKYNCHKQTVYNIVHNNQWSNIE